MIIVDRYKSVLSLEIVNDCLQQFIQFFSSIQDKNTFKENSYSISFICSEVSCVYINSEEILIEIKPQDYKIILEDIIEYSMSEKKFPLDISLEQLGFKIYSDTIKDVIIESGLPH
jgi:hypothetical protein